MEKAYTPAEVAQHLQVPEDTLTHWRYKKKGPAWFYAGKHVRYRESVVLAWMRKGEEGNGAERESA